MSDANAMIQTASKVLEPLIKDCETLAHNPDLSPRACNELIRGAAGWKIELNSGRLSLGDLCGLIESIYGIIFVAKKKCPRFDAQHPGIIRRLDDAKTFVLKATGEFVGSAGKTILDINIEI